MSQNIFELFTADPVEYNMKHLKVQLFAALTKLIRENGWTQTEAAQALNISSPRMSNLFKGYLEKFSIDALIEMLVRIGYKLDVDFNPDNRQQPLTMNVKKATL
ncbi:PtxR [Pseudomonas syringae pv. theae ICMP 3923]|uniref:PtxR n=8 Tax=Pseudomonas TaxID=286 RepID=F3G4U5_PSESJ|nr:XRE family transcriptional regulator [Pseudomonas syringae pv. actinidiae]EGH42095.1 PtxR [Pseudomonas syringae pv. pisi str. 1704B]EPM73606.1 PtxR [Pseudomonas syringae pv. theae ICMP 3923]MBL3828814.1 XRE family transcriptional regulator [Pseudomonas syringae pv. theae]OZI87199.1 transcriptional regulator [Pseudomonas avellanae]POR58376.1 PtxR [Pseudomonas syringae pv. syringae]PYD10230.1 XRE family transcriptional regulator [Pseudomonas syringae pv. pisi]RMN53969.1 PtxR [Pseudomonas sy